MVQFLDFCDNFDEQSSIMSSIDEATNDLKVARNGIYKLGETFKQLQSHSLSILTLSDQWQNLQNSFGKVQNMLENRVREFEAKNREIDATNNGLENMKKEVELKKKELELEEESLRERSKRVEIREKQLKDWYESLNLGKKEIVERFKAVKLREEQFLERFERVRAVEEACCGREDECRKREEACCEREKVLKENVEKMELRAKQLSEESNVRAKELKDLSDELNVRAKELKELSEEVCLKQSELNRRILELEQKEISFEEKRKKLEVSETQLDEFYSRVDSLERELIEKGELLESKEKMLGLKEDEIKEQKKALESREKELNELSLELHSDSSSLRTDDVIHSMCKNMDAYGLRSYLIEHFNKNEIDTLNERLIEGLKCAPDPAELVLYVCQSFHRKFSDKSLSYANKNCCIFLLDQFMKLSLPIAQALKDEAMYIASLLRACLKPVGNSVEDNYGYLLFIAAFGLGIFYNSNELISLFGQFYGGPDVYRHEQQEPLCRALGLSWLMPDVIRSLIGRKKLLTAIKYTCLFKLECLFPLAPLLEEHLDSVKKRVNAKHNEGTFTAKVQADCMELSFLYDVTRFITAFKLESILPPYTLSRISELELEKERRKTARFNKRSASASSCSSIASSKQLQKRPRVQNAHHDNTDN